MFPFLTPNSNNLLFVPSTNAFTTSLFHLVCTIPILRSFPVRSEGAFGIECGAMMTVNLKEVFSLYDDEENIPTGD